MQEMLGLISRSGRSPGGGMATHFIILAWRIPWTEEPDGLQSMDSQRVRHDWSDWAHKEIFILDCGEKTALLKLPGQPRCVKAGAPYWSSISCSQIPSSHPKSCSPVSKWNLAPNLCTGGQNIPAFLSSSYTMFIGIYKFLFYLLSLQDFKQSMILLKKCDQIISQCI